MNTTNSKVIITDGTTTMNLATTCSTAAGASALTILAAGGAGVKNRFYRIILGSDTAGLIVLNDSMGSYYCPANGTIIIDYGHLGLKQGTSNAAVTATLAGANLSAVCMYKADA